MLKIGEKKQNVQSNNLTWYFMGLHIADKIYVIELEKLEFVYNCTE